LEPSDGPECGTGNATSGICSYKLVSNGTTKRISLRYKYSGNAGNQISFSLARKATPVSPAGRVIIMIVIINNDGTTQREVLEISRDSLNTWQQYTVNATASKNFRAVFISVVDNLDSGTIWIDKPSLKIVNTQELLIDPKLETFIPIDWDSGDNFDPTEGANCNQGNSSSGNCSFYLVADGSKKVLSVRYKYFGHSGDKIDFGVFRKSTSLSASGRVIIYAVVKYLDGTSDRVVVPISVGTLNVWQQFKGQLTAAKDYKAIFLLVMDNLNSGTMWMDDFYLDVNP